MTAYTAAVRSAAPSAACLIVPARSRAHRGRIDAHVGRLLRGYVEHIAEAVRASDAGSAARHSGGRHAGLQQSCQEDRTLAEPLEFSGTASRLAMRSDLSVAHGTLVCIVAEDAGDW